MISDLEESESPRSMIHKKREFPFNIKSLARCLVSCLLSSLAISNHIVIILQQPRSALTDNAPKFTYKTTATTMIDLTQQS